MKPAFRRTILKARAQALGTESQNRPGSKRAMSISKRKGPKARASSMNRMSALRKGARGC